MCSWRPTYLPSRAICPQAKNSGDLYSLGVTLYQMLTGALPFAAANPMEWIHCHIARQPAPPLDRGTMPEPLFVITMKLLAKNAEERYETAAGPEADLRRCLVESESRGRIDPFALGTHDVPENLQGREREAKLRQLAAQAESKALRAQVNPHFLFNSLNTVADLIVTDPAKAETLTVLLAKVFRHVLMQSDRQLTRVGEEMDFLRTYVDPGVSRETIPSLILQPVVENASKHGLAPKISEGNLSIVADWDGEFVKLAVEDDALPRIRRSITAKLQRRRAEDYRGEASGVVRRPCASQHREGSGLR